MNVFIYPPSPGQESLQSGADMVGPSVGCRGEGATLIEFLSWLDGLRDGRMAHTVLAR